MLQSKQAFAKSLENLCLELLHQGYDAMLGAKGYQLDWKEDKLTVHYIAHMTGLRLRKENQITITPQYIIYSDQHAFGEDEVETAPRIDFKFSKWVQKEEIDYFAEAKNVSEKSWKKKNGTRVDATKYNTRYIETGINHLITSHYPSNCVLIAYVLNGHKNAVLTNLNRLIISNHEGYGIITKPEMTVNEEYYISKNSIEGKTIILKHLFLQLYTQEHRRNAEIERIIQEKRKKIEKVNDEEKIKIEQQISLLEYVMNEKFQGESGALRINLAWKTKDDLDLHIVTPNGKIYYDNKTIDFGKLDVDANAFEPFNDNPQENIVFSTIPKGKSVIKVNFHTSRENINVDFVLSILTPNDEIKVYLKTVNIETGRMIEVAEFECTDSRLIISDK